MNKIIILLALLFSSISAFGKEINLYDQPKADATVVGTIDPTVGIIPIFSSKDGDWMKIGDPQNGNVGWIKSADITNQTGTSSFTFTQRVTNDSKGVPHTYQIMQFGVPSQKEIQQSVQKSFQKMINDINEIYKQQSMIWSNSPVIVPVVLVPQQKQEKSKTPPSKTP